MIDEKIYYRGKTRSQRRTKEEIREKKSKLCRSCKDEFLKIASGKFAYCVHCGAKYRLVGMNKITKDRYVEYK